MDTHLEKNTRRNSIIVAVLIVMAVFGILALIPVYSFKTILAILAFSISIVLPFYQKRFSFYSVFLVIAGLLFLLSGVIGQEADNFLSSLSITSQIEFSKIMRPKRVSMGLWNAGIGLCIVMLAWNWWTSFRNRSQPSKVMVWSSLLWGVMGILFIILGIFSVLNGLSRL